MSTIITSIDPGSPAMRAGLRPGQQLLSINGHDVVDVLDYRFYGYDPVSHLMLKNEDGSTQSLTVHKAEGEDLGLNFDTYLMDEMRSCANHCIFCFVDQMPPGMRQTLYFKDDDARLSFLHGNYITLTNLTEREAQRIIDLRISPINVSVHTTDPQLHCTMLGNKDAARSLDYIRAFCQAGIVMNGQIVVCPGWNDGDQLRRTLRDLTEMEFSSCSLVPVGITKYRKGLARLKPWTPNAPRDSDIAEEFGQENLRRFGTRRFFRRRAVLRRPCGCRRGLLRGATGSFETAWVCSLFRERPAAGHGTSGHSAHSSPLHHRHRSGREGFMRHRLTWCGSAGHRCRARYKLYNDFFWPHPLIAGLLTGRPGSPAQAQALGPGLIPLHMLRQERCSWMTGRTAAFPAWCSVQVVGIDGYTCATPFSIVRSREWQNL